MPLIPPDPLRIIEMLRIQLEDLAALAIDYPDRAEYTVALNNIAGAAVLLERSVVASAKGAAVTPR
jgi:hypothetical protein